MREVLVLGVGILAELGIKLGVSALKWHHIIYLIYSGPNILPLAAIGLIL